MTRPDKPYDAKRIFWDIDPEKLDFEKKASFIIGRVFERGDVEDIRMCRRYYGDEKVSGALMKAKWIRKETVFLAAALFNNEPTDYRCYRESLLNPTHYLY
jgi:hypothetical protein